MLAQAVVIAVGTLALIVTAFLVAPGLFHWHLTHAGEADPQVLKHAEEAFASTFAIAVLAGTVLALAAAGIVSWVLVRRISRPVEDLARAAEAVAGGEYRVKVPAATFARELTGLSQSFADMADRLAETEANRTKLLADLAHELRTPLATLEAYIDGLEDDVVEPVPQSWTTMRSQVARLRRLAGDLRDVADAEEHALGMTFTMLDANDVVAGAVTAATPRYLAKGVGLIGTRASEPCTIRGDAVRLQQVLANLLENALRHTPEGGRVTVGVVENAGRVLLVVSDNGEGIPPGELPFVFDRFHRADPARVSADGSGSGLGLTIARAIVADHGGALTARSPGPGLGAEFTVDLPGPS